MFYYPDVLHRHSGCFSTIWLAATNGVKLTRREFLRVDVNKTCGMIVDFVTAQVPAPQPNLPRPRFSLYLSSQLQYGMVVVYHRQCGFLLDEVQQTIDRLLHSRNLTFIDMAKCDRMVLEVPDNLYMMEEAEGAQDPFFGLMESLQLPSPYKIREAESSVEKDGPQHSLVPGSHTMLDKSFRSPPDVITLIEKDQFVIPTDEHFVGDDLPEATAQDIDLLLEQPDQFHGEVEERQTETTREGTMCSVHQLKETVLGAEQQSVLMLEEDSGQPATIPMATVAQEMTPLHVAMPAPPTEASSKVSDRAMESSSEEGVVPPVRKPDRRRRRQLVFADLQVQLSDREMKEQIGNVWAETLKLSEALLDFPSLTHLAFPAQLFSTPCGSLLHADLQSLWKQQASLAVLPEQAEQHIDEEEEQERELLRTKRKMRQSSKEVGVCKRHPLSWDCSKQKAHVRRPSSFSEASVSDTILDMFKEDRSASSVITPVSRWSLQEEVQLPMEPIAEENIAMPDEKDAVSENVLSMITSTLQRFEEVIFDSLLPPETNRPTAAGTLHKLLELLSAGQVTACQDKPYSSIIIKPPALTTDPSLKLAADEKKHLLEEGEADAKEARGEPRSRAGRELIVRVEVERDIPMSVSLPIQVEPDPAHRPFPFLDTTLADLGIQESEVKERVVWVDTKKTQVKNKAGKLKEKETTLLEVRVKVQKPGDKQLQEILYSTEAHTDRSFCRTGIDILPWKQRHTGDKGLTPVQMTMALDNQQPGLTEAEEQREI
ncbi:meiotic recombination protein REC8 homolog [Pholidichthys leucotaenia]